MTAEGSPSRRGTAATVMATAALTLAVGVTVAAFAGYLGPRPVPAPREVAPAPSLGPAPAADSPSVVLVPVAQRPPAGAPQARVMPAVAQEPILTAYSPSAHEDEDNEDGEHEREDDD